MAFALSAVKSTLHRVAAQAVRPYSSPCAFSITPPNEAVLGLGRPVNDAGRWTRTLGNPSKRSRFPNALEDWSDEPLTLRERAMMGMTESIMGKADWHRKVFDEDICGRWRIEAQDQDFSEKMFDYCIAELQDNAQFFRENGFAPMLDATATIYAGDDYIENEVRQALRFEAGRLEDKGDEEKDWHPGSGGKVLNLVHPSLYPLVYGRTRAIIGSGDTTAAGKAQRPWKGEIIPEPAETECNIAKFFDIGQGMSTQAYSQKFQWLPCDVHLSGNNRQARITSYINNLHTQEHASLYRTIEKIIEKALPMWNRTLTALEREYQYTRIQTDSIVLAESAKRPRPPAENEDDLDEDDKLDLDAEWEDEIYAIVPPEPSDYSVRSRFRQSSEDNGARVQLHSDFADKGIQVIVKLANIHLTPANPEYSGGSWHMEGQLNEHICATALYYYDSINITDSHLAFRERSKTYKLEDFPYEQDRYGWIEDHYGIENLVPSIQELGRVSTREGRLLTFPNVLQHRVEPFRLADPSKSGHRKVLALFLVDPHLRIPSTSIVPPQQREWWKDGPPVRLPPETVQYFSQGNSDVLMDITEGKKIRLELMKERSAFVQESVTPRLMTSCNFCEH